jgi:hypothetical protein
LYNEEHLILGEIKVESMAIWLKNPITALKIPLKQNTTLKNQEI